MEKKHNKKNQSNSSKKIEDPLAPTPIKDRSDSSKKSSKHEYISHEELKDKLDTYANLNEEKADYFKYKKIEDEYEADLSKIEDNQNKQDLNYSMGIRQSLPHTPYHDIRNVHERVKQNHRTKTADNAKEAYDSSQDNLRVHFKGNKENTTSKTDEKKTSKSFDNGKAVFEKLQKKYGTKKSKAKDKGRAR